MRFKPIKFLLFLLLAVIVNAQQFHSIQQVIATPFFSKLPAKMQHKPTTLAKTNKNDTVEGENKKSTVTAMNSTDTTYPDSTKSIYEHTSTAATENSTSTTESPKVI
jgi:hypothetical protein